MSNRNIFEYMKCTSASSDNYTLALLDSLKKEGKDIFEYTGHLPRLRNVLVKSEGQPKTRNSLARLIFESLSDESWTRIIPALSFIELSTISTYVLDDVIDNQPERQGEEATWKKYGMNKAFIGGNIQTFVSLKALNHLDVPNPHKLRIFDIANDMWLKLWIGEGFNEEMKAGTTFEEYVNRCYNLAGVMFDSVSQISAICADGGGEESVRIAGEIGRNYGLATMIRNDLADLLPQVRKRTRAHLKRSYEDARKGIWTYPIVHAMQNGSEREKRAITCILGKEASPAEFARLSEILAECGALEATFDLVTHFKNVANGFISKLPYCETRGLLLDLTEALENLRKMPGP